VDTSPTDYRVLIDNPEGTSRERFVSGAVYSRDEAPLVALEDHAQDTGQDIHTLRVRRVREVTQQVSINGWKGCYRVTYRPGDGYTLHIKRLNGTWGRNAWFVDRMGMTAYLRFLGGVDAVDLARAVARTD